MQLPTSDSATLIPFKPALRPLAKRDRSATQSPRPERRNRAGRRTRILLVEDEADLRLALKARLTHQGFDVAVALDGVAARCSMLTCRYDAVILDLGLPKSHGLDVLSEVSERKKLPPVIVLTGGDVHEQGVALMLGADVVLQKPCSFEDLTAAIDGLLPE